MEEPTMTPDAQRRECGGAPEPRPSDQPTLQNLIPIAVVIAAGCESCAEKMVRRALQEGSSRQQVLKTIGIVESLHGAECFRNAIAQDVRDRMVKPLARARQTADDGAGGGTDAPGRSCC
jgi:hypothetical protein